MASLLIRKVESNFVGLWFIVYILYMIGKVNGDWQALVCDGGF